MIPTVATNGQSNSIPTLNSVKKEAIRLEKALLIQHVSLLSSQWSFYSLNEIIFQKRRAADIIQENRKRAVTYWTAQQLMLHNKCKERGAVEDTLISPETSFVMPLHLLKKPENGNLEEALREHEVSR